MSKMHCLSNKFSKIVKRRGSLPRAPLKGILNSNFQAFSFQLRKKIDFFEIKKDLGFRVLHVTSETEDI